MDVNGEWVCIGTGWMGMGSNVVRHFSVLRFTTTDLMINVYHHSGALIAMSTPIVHNSHSIVVVHSFVLFITSIHVRVAEKNPRPEVNPSGGIGERERP